MKKTINKRHLFSLIAVIVLGGLVPTVTRTANRAVMWLVGAEGRLASISVETDRPLGPMPKVWSGLAQGGENLEYFLTQNEKEITVLRPEYIRIDHIYDMFGVVQKDPSGLRLDWTRLDKVVESMITIGAKPFLSLSYMPIALSGEGIVSEPEDWKEWSWLVKSTIEHYSGKIGIEDVYYEVWNEPDLFGGWRMGGKKDYKNLYYYAAKGATQAQNVKRYKLGGPATTGLYRNWMDNFFPFVLKHNLRLDFFSWHRYDSNLDRYVTDVNSVDRWLEKQPYFSGVEKVISELGPRSEAGGVNDTNTGAAHLTAVTRELMGKVKYGFSFAVSGKWGIVGKPRYQALEFLSRLGPDRLSVTGEGTWVKAIAARSGTASQVILVNYDARERHYEVVPVNFLGLKQDNFVLRRQALGEKMTETKLATNSAVLQTKVIMPANSVVWLELTPEN